jgi:CRISPR-associated protein Cas2
MMGHHVVVYDVTDDRRRTKLREALKNFGFPVQYSVFEAELTPTALARLRRMLKNQINPKEDSVILFFLCERCAKQVERLGTATDPFASPTIVV